MSILEKKKLGIFFFVYLPVAGRNEKKKKVYTYVFRYFSNSMCEKKNVYMYFFFFLVIFQQLKKKSAQKVQQKRIWATAQLSCEKKKIVYCNLAIVMQERGLKKNIVLQYTILYCREEGLMAGLRGFVLQ